MGNKHTVLEKVPGTLNYTHLSMFSDWEGERLPPLLTEHSDVRIPMSGWQEVMSCS